MPIAFYSILRARTLIKMNEFYFLIKYTQAKDLMPTIVEAQGSRLAQKFSASLHCKHIAVQQDRVLLRFNFTLKNVRLV